MREARRAYSQYLTKPYPVQYPSTTDWQQIGGGQIGTNQIFGQAITEAQLADGSISSAKIGSISASDITTGTLDADRIETNAITASHLAANSVTSSEISANAVTADKINVSTLSAISANMGTITAGTISAGTVNADTITTGTLNGARIQDGGVTSGKIGSGAVTSAKLASSVSTTQVGAVYHESGLSSGTKPGFLCLGGSSGYWFTYNTTPNAGGGTTVVINGNGQIGVNSSDRRLKKDIVNYKGGLEKIMKLRPVSFVWKKDKRSDIGLIAQEVEVVYPEAANKPEDMDYYAMDYAKLVTPLISALQEQQAQIEELKTQIAELQGN